MNTNVLKLICIKPKQIRRRRPHIRHSSAQCSFFFCTAELHCAELGCLNIYFNLKTAHNRFIWVLTKLYFKSIYVADSTTDLYSKYLPLFIYLCQLIFKYKIYRLLLNYYFTLLLTSILEFFTP